MGGQDENERHLELMAQNEHLKMEIEAKERERGALQAAFEKERIENQQIKSELKTYSFGWETSCIDTREEIQKLREELAEAHEQWMKLRADRSNKNLAFFAVFLAALSLGPVAFLSRR